MRCIASWTVHTTSFCSTWDIRPTRISCLREGTRHSVRLRQQGGISGFPRRSESEYDSFSVGHASTAISAALGMARARDALGDDYQVVAVVGDGALTGGMCYEALNDLGTTRTHMTIILNDNEMSIARNVGALSRHLTRLRNSSTYRATKALVRSRLGRLKHIGPMLISALEHIKDALKQVFVRGSFFEVFGLEYFRAG